MMTAQALSNEFAEALKVATKFSSDFDRITELTEEILVMYRRGWTDGADHVLAKFREIRAEPRSSLP